MAPSSTSESSTPVSKRSKRNFEEVTFKVPPRLDSFAVGSSASRPNRSIPKALQKLNRPVKRFNVSGLCEANEPEEILMHVRLMPVAKALGQVDVFICQTIDRTETNSSTSGPSEAFKASKSFFGRPGPYGTLAKQGFDLSVCS